MGNGKCALVTGGGRGIGAGIVERLASEGWDVAFTDLRPAEDFAATLAGLEKRHGVKARYYLHDVSRVETHAETVARIVADFGAIRALVNNAGVAPNVRADLLEAGPESFDRVMNINLRGPFFLTQAVARHWAERKAADASFDATLVSIGSVSATWPSTNRGEYCFSKAGVAMLTLLYAARLAELDIPVYELRPGIIMSDMTGPVKEKYDRLIGGGLTLQKRWGQPEDVAKAVAMLVRGDLAYSTGQVIGIDGGMQIQRL